MQPSRGRLPLVVVAAALACSGCGKSAEEREAERHRADAEWRAEAAVAESWRQKQEEQLVKQQLAEHEQREQVDDERERKVAEIQINADRARLIEQVRARVANPAAARFGNDHWNAARTGLCGTVSIVNTSGVYSDYKGFVAAHDDVVIDSDETHARYASASAEADCAP